MKTRDLFLAIGIVCGIAILILLFIWFFLTPDISNFRT
jgi:hypothetical protein